ncbi:hypothetical protein KC19_1G155800 [Ceratodon purpureus]|uniref:Uncharacterized protein n=1 Tax=Ceratodon purpureus TaxID=3225 RepID=A0A8T0J5K1_CERPU|nr:hypothetical protein KC19_1G155800 [Ceratodon purpureus]
MSHLRPSTPPPRSNSPATSPLPRHITPPPQTPKPAQPSPKPGHRRRSAASSPRPGNPAPASPDRFPRFILRLKSVPQPARQSPNPFRNSPHSPFRLSRAPQSASVASVSPPPFRQLLRLRLVPVVRF